MPWALASTSPSLPMTKFPLPSVVVPVTATSPEKYELPLTWKMLVVLMEAFVPITSACDVSIG